jgi:predicted RecA/RadA family phage recombinase
MQNYVQKGDTLTVTAPYALSAGDGCKVGAMFGIACGDYAEAAEAEIAVVGVFDITALSTDTASGSTLVSAYWDDTNKRVTTTSSTHLKIGTIVAAKTSGQTTARVRLNGSF